MGEENESRTVQITVLITPSEKAALDAAKERWARSLGSEVHGRIAYTLAMSDEVDFLNRAPVIKDPVAASGELEEYRKLFKAEISDGYGNVSVPSSISDSDLDDFVRADEMLAQAVNLVIEETDLVFYDADFKRMTSVDWFSATEVEDIDLYSIVSSAFTDAVVSVFDKYPEPDKGLPLVRRAFSRLARSSEHLQRWAFLFLNVMLVKARREAMHTFEELLLKQGLQQAEGNREICSLFYQNLASAHRDSYMKFVRVVSPAADDGLAFDLIDFMESLRNTE